MTNIDGPSRDRPMTLPEKIWHRHVVHSAPGEADLLYIDLHLVHEVTSPQAFDGLRLSGRTVRRPELTIATEDHNVPTADIHLPIADEISAKQVDTLRRNAAEFGVTNFPMGDPNQGIVHVIGPEQGRTLPGTTIVCGDSHTATHGAFGALAFGIGTSEVEHVLATQTLPQSRPKWMSVTVEGDLPAGVTAKDVILAIIGRIGTGGGIGYNQEEFEAIAKGGIELSPVNEILIEESLLGWKEYEMEVMRDQADNCVIICSIENFDPMGVHTGDSITVAPIQTLTDKEFQIMRDQSFAVIRAVGVETGGSNIQFGVSPENGRMVIIEMNPRVSRSSALASKATGFPIAKIAAKLAVGYLLDELKNDITRETPASFEPSIDYVVTKIPRFAFEKFPQADPTLTTQMKSVGEAMAIGRTFKESLQKCLRSLEIGRSGLGGDGKPWRIGTEVYGDRDILPRDVISRKLSVPNAERIFFIRHALRAGFTIEEIFNLTKIDRWFLVQIKEIVDFEEELAGAKNLGLGEK